jgi:hypothetical protein
MKTSPTITLSVLAFAIGLFASGCAVDGASESTLDSEPPETSATNEALTSTSLSGGDLGSTTLDPNAGDSTLKPAFSVSWCIYEKMGQGWGENRATAYCKCRAQGYSDWYCNSYIPYIDL